MDVVCIFSNSVIKRKNKVPCIKNWYGSWPTTIANRIVADKAGQSPYDERREKNKRSL